MGSFSFMRADKTTKQLNFVDGDAVKMLIPQEFGGGFFKGYYDDYGIIKNKDRTESVDVYEVLAFWNREEIMKDGKKIKDKLSCDKDSFYKTYPNETFYTISNRSYGIIIYFEDLRRREKGKGVLLKYPLKLVSASYKGTYEDLDGISEDDPSQGFEKLTENNLKKWLW